MKFLLIAIFIALVGCTSVQQYEGEKRPDSEVGILLKPKNNLIISHINGKHRGLGTSDRYDFLPGKTTITVGYIGSTASTITSTKPIDLNVNFEAGKKYQVKYSLDGRSWKAWVVDLDSGEKVSN